MCDTVVVVDDDGVWFAKNSDRDPNEAQRLDWQPARAHPAGATVRCTAISIPQVSRTHAVLLSRPFWMWGAEMGVNEHGLAIGNEAVFTHAPVGEVGLTGMDLVRLALERCSTAREAVDTIVALAAEHGQGGPMGHENRSFRYHSSFLVADPGGAFVLETAGEAHAVEAVRGVRAISNGLTIPGFTDRWARRLHGRVAACGVRRARVEQLAQGTAAATDLFAVLRDHGPDPRPTYRLHHGAMAAPCMHAGGLIAASQTTGSWVSRLAPGGCRHWATATAAPCTGLFKPVAVDRPLDLGTPTDVADDSLWWRHERWHRAVVGLAHERTAPFRAERDGLEARWMAEPPDPAQAFVAGDELLARWSARIPELAGPDERPWHVRRYWRIRDGRAGLSARGA